MLCLAHKQRSRQPTPPTQQPSTRAPGSTRKRTQHPLRLLASWYCRSRRHCGTSRPLAVAAWGPPDRSGEGVNGQMPQAARRQATSQQRGEHKPKAVPQQPAGPWQGARVKARAAPCTKARGRAGGACVQRVATCCWRAAADAAERRGLHCSGSGVGVGALEGQAHCCNACHARAAKRYSKARRQSLATRVIRGPRSSRRAVHKGVQRRSRQSGHAAKQGRRQGVKSGHVCALQPREVRQPPLHTRQNVTSAPRLAQARHASRARHRRPARQGPSSAPLPACGPCRRAQARGALWVALRASLRASPTG